jgi:ABC-type branched-subunit amino acid transport system substrate-binding protein
MENSNTTTLAIVLIVGLVIGGGIGYFAAPSGGTETVEVAVNPLAGKTIELGFISPQTSDVAWQTPYFQEIIEPDIKKYTDKLGFDIEFTWLIDDAQQQAAIHLEKAQSFKARDVNVFMGGGWSSQAQSALSYVNENDMLMISWSSTSPLLAEKDDYLLRTCPTDRTQGPAIGQMLESWGIEAVLVIQRADSWGDGIWNIIEPNLQERGIVILEQVRYATESTEFSNYLATMDNILGDAIDEYGAEKVGVMTMMFDELAVICTQTPDFPNTRKVLWFGTETSGRNEKVLDDSGNTQDDLRVFSSLMTPAAISKTINLENRFNPLTGRVLGFYQSSLYDGIWITAASILEVGGYQSDYIADLAIVYQNVANNWFGTSGWCSLDENGDRLPQIFDIWGYSTTDSRGFQSWGQYNGRDIIVTWNDELPAAEGLTRPAA